MIKHALGWMLAGSLTLSVSVAADESPARERPTTALPYTPSLDVTSLDRNADACEDLYQFACGGWIRNNPIPPDQARWSTYGKAYSDNQRYLWGILEQDAQPRPERNATQTLIGDYFAACMNLERIDALGITPLQSSLNAVNALKDVASIGGLVGQLIAATDSTNFFVGIGSQQDAKESDKVIGAIYAGGLGLPDRDYYIEDSEDRVKTRQAYREHVAAMFVLLGESPDQADRSAETVMTIETGLAKATLTVVERRDPYKVYHRKTTEELQAMTPAFDWGGLFSATGMRTEPWLNVTQPSFMEAMQSTLAATPLSDLKTYLRWALVNARATELSKPFRDQAFAFYSTHLQGITEQRARWRTCVQAVDQQLGDALGQEFVNRNFPPEVRDDVQGMSLEIQAVMAERIDGLGWMSPETRRQAHEKLTKMRQKIGYPDEWRDYSSIRIDRADFFGNVSRATAFDLVRQLSKIGKPVDRDEWFMTPSTVNAYYSPSLNDINFPAGVLMPPLYDPKMDDAPNYGNTGGTIGHELVHGFDDEGRQFDGDGNLRDWWTPGDAMAFEERAQCIRDQYGSYQVIDDILINSALTSGEDIADLGGLILAWEAWKKTTADVELPLTAGLTGEQRFFVGFAQWACADERPESLRLHAATDPHSPPKYRINGVVANMPEFARAFGCKADAAMVKPVEKVCRIW